MQLNRPKLRGLVGKHISHDALRRVDHMRLPRLARVSDKANLDGRFLNSETQIIEEAEHHTSLQHANATLKRYRQAADSPNKPSVRGEFTVSL
jgi:hypothetical protein